MARGERLKGDPQAGHVKPGWSRGGPARLLEGLRGYLAHKKAPTPCRPLQDLDIGPRKGPRGLRFLVCEVPQQAEKGPHRESVR